MFEADGSLMLMKVFAHRFNALRNLEWGNLGSNLLFGGRSSRNSNSSQKTLMSLVCKELA